jgi:hypothetical protein
MPDNQQGPGILEFAIIVALVVAVIVLILILLGPQITNVFMHHGGIL